MKRLTHNQKKDFKFRLLPEIESNETFRNCDCCSYPAPTTKYETEGKVVHLCILCYNSDVSNSMIYPNSCESSTRRIVQTQAFMTNALLDQAGAFDGFETVEEELEN